MVEDLNQTHPEFLEQESQTPAPAHAPHMPVWLWVIPALFALGALGLAFKLFQESTTSASVLNNGRTLVSGGPAPEFQLQTSDGNMVSLSDYRGKAVMLNFWATWCAPCRSEMPDMEKVYKEKLGQDVVILAVNVQEAQVPVQAFVDRFSLTFPILMDVNGDLVEEYGIQSLPTSYFIDKQGRIASFSLGALNESAISRRIEDALRIGS